MSQVLHGVVRGGKVELMDGGTFADGQRVQVVVEPQPVSAEPSTGPTPEEGVIHTPASPELLEFLDQVRRNRPPSRRARPGRVGGRPPEGLPMTPSSTRSWRRSRAAPTSAVRSRDELPARHERRFGLPQAPGVTRPQVRPARGPVGCTRQRSYSPSFTFHPGGSPTPARCSTPSRRWCATTLVRDDVTVLDFDARCASVFGRVRAERLNAGVSIPLTDLLIGSVALEHDLTIATHNTDHFALIPGLRLVDWLDS